MPEAHPSGPLTDEQAAQLEASVAQAIADCGGDVPGGEGDRRTTKRGAVTPSSYLELFGRQPDSLCGSP